MKLPVWIWDPHSKQYLRLPTGWLRVYPDGKLGFETLSNDEQSMFLSRYSHLFKYDRKWLNPFNSWRAGLSGLIGGRWLVKTKKPQPHKGPRWYSQEKHQIKGFQK